MKEGAKPYHGRPNPIAQIHKATIMKEIKRLEGKGVMKRQSSSQWASLTFIIPKKDMTVWTIPILGSSINGLSGDLIQFPKSAPHHRSLKASPMQWL